MEPITSSAAPTLDVLESRLVELEALIAACRSEQLDLLGALEAECVAALDGARTFTEWTAARLDVTPTTAKDLVNASRTVADRPAAAGGATDPDNLATLCWYHHHIVIHGRGYRIDPTSPPQRLRFHRPDPRSPP